MVGEDSLYLDKVRSGRNWGKKSRQGQIGKKFENDEARKNSMMISLPSPRLSLLSVSFSKLNSIDFILSVIDDHWFLCGTRIVGRQEQEQKGHPEI